MQPTRKYAGLSPSSLSLYCSCPRKFYLKKILKAKPDPGVDEDTEALRVGSAFHKVLEDTRHDLTGLKYQTVADVAAEHDLEADDWAPMLFAMLGKYRVMHERAGLKVLACETTIDLPEFFGIVDVVLGDDAGGWWIGDMKTAAGVSATLAMTLASHLQLALYVTHRHRLAEKLGLDNSKFLGCRYRLSTKSKMARKKEELTADYIKRISKAVRAIDFVLPKEILHTEGAYESLEAAKAAITAADKDPTKFPRNYGNCNSYFRLCEHYSHCHGRPASSAAEGIKIIDSE